MAGKKSGKTRLTVLDPNKLYLRAPISGREAFEYTGDRRPEIEYDYNLALRSLTNMDSQGNYHGWTIHYSRETGLAQRADLFDHGKAVRRMFYDYYGRLTKSLYMHPELRDTCQGPAEYIDPDSKCRAYGSFRNGKLHGKWHFYYKGHLYETARFVNGVRHGFVTHYDNDGKIISRAIIKRNKPNGIALWWENGKIIGRASYKDGKPVDHLPYQIAKKFPARYAFSVALQEFIKNRQKIYWRIDNFTEVMGSFVDLGYKDPREMLKNENVSLTAEKLARLAKLISQTP